MADNSFHSTVTELFKGMNSFITTKTVVGDAIHIGDTIIMPLVDVSFGVGAGAFSENAKNNGGGGMGGKISPSAILVITKNGTKLVNIKHQDAITKILDLVPDVMNKFSKDGGSSEPMPSKTVTPPTEADIDAIIDEVDLEQFND